MRLSQLLSSLYRRRSEANRPAKFYQLTKAGKKQLAAEEENWERIAGAVARVLSQA